MRPDWNGGDGRNHYILAADDGFPNNLFWLLIGQAGELVLQTSAGRVGADPTMKLRSEPLGWRAGEWHFVQCEWGPDAARLFADGMPVAGTEQVVVPPSLGAVLHMGNLHNGGWCLDGTLDDLRIRRGQ